MTGRVIISAWISIRGQPSHRTGYSLRRDEDVKCVLADFAWRVPQMDRRLLESGNFLLDAKPGVLLLRSSD